MMLLLWVFGPVAVIGLWCYVLDWALQRRIDAGQVRGRLPY